MNRDPPSPAQSPQRWVAALERVRTQNTEEKSHSEPGAATEHDRFAAYINRFSSMDQRMQYQITRPATGDAKTGKGVGGGNERSPNEGRNAKGNSLTEAAFQSAVRSRQQQQGETPARSNTFRSRLLERHGGGVAQSYSRYRGHKINSATVQETKSDLGVWTTNRMRGSSRTPERRRSLSREQEQPSTPKSTIPPEETNARSRPTTPRRGSGSRLQEYRDNLRAQAQQYLNQQNESPDAQQATITTADKPNVVTPDTEEPKPRSRPTTPPRSVKRLLDYRRTVQTRQQLDEQPDDVEQDDTGIIEFPSVIQQIDDRAEIETPSPARVSDIRQKLWTEKEHLRVQWREQKNNGPPHGSKLKTGLASPEEGRRFKERYYAAAQRGVVHQETKKVNDLDPQKRSETVDNLIAKLGTVNRENPQTALAQIDEILRTQPQAEDSTDPQHDDDDESSEDSSVSSITDPTYEEVSKSKLGRNSSAIANGRTRPSALSKYAKPVKVVNGSSGNSRLRPRKHRGAFPSADEVAAESKDNTKKAQPIATRSFSQIKRDIEREDDIRDVDASDSGILDTGADELLEVERKIKRWDELSTGIIPTKNEEAKVVDKKETSTKSHPWEGGISPRSVAAIRRQPVVNVRDTTMDSADGIEAEFATEKSQGTATPVRKLRQERLLRENRPSTIVEEGTTQDEGVTERTEAFEEFLPAFNPRREKTKAMAEEYDSAWINLPHSGYFGQPRHERSSQRLKQNAPGGVLRHLPHGEVEVGYMNMDSINADQAITTGHRDMNVGHREPVQAEDESSKSRNSLKGFLNHRSDHPRRGEHMTYTSTGSRRYQNLKAKLEAMDSQRERPAMSARLSSNQSRSRSLDERRESARGTRNPNLAKKFSRLLKVYDEDKSRSHLSR